VYEITPEGLKPTVEVPHGQSIRKLTGRRLDRAIIAVLGGVEVIAGQDLRPAFAWHSSRTTSYGCANASLGIWAATQHASR
jgi:hypothetical protein